MKITHIVPVGVLILLLIAMLFTAGWNHPPIASEQRGYRGLGMVQHSTPAARAVQEAENQIPEPLPAVPAGGPTAGETYQNVQILGDLSVGQFTRLMAAMTAWVSPEQGCNYCHNPENLASDDLYTKVVSRRMLEMTQHINTDLKDHVADTGVTCYTCHRGHPVPSNLWFSDKGIKQAGGMAADRDGQNLAAASVGYTSLPFDSFSKFLNADESIRVVSRTALPEGNTQNIKQTEWTYGLMMHLSQSLGVNCTYCHNSRSFFSWDQSTPQRTTAYYGLSMVRDLNKTYLEPLADVFPENRLGPHGDVPKVNCATCHQGAYKPLYGANMLKDYPSLAAAPAAEAEAPAAEAEAPAAEAEAPAAEAPAAETTEQPAEETTEQPAGTTNN